MRARPDRAGAPAAPAPVRHHFTVDVEEYFQVSAFEGIVPRESWSGFESRVHASMDVLLSLLARHETRGTFFVLGWIAERFPDLVRQLVDGGHEVASHGWDHRRVTHITPDEFRASVADSKSLLESITGERVLGFRAPSFSIVPGLEWALDILVEEGYSYDSSLFPVRRRGYGYAGARTEPHLLERPAGTLMEFPPGTLRLGGLVLPAGGGAYFRLFPYSVVRTALATASQRAENATFYIHPWEVDPEQPRLSVNLATRVRHYGGLRRTLPRLERLLSEFHFGPIRETARSLCPASC